MDNNVLLAVIAAVVILALIVAAAVLINRRRGGGAPFERRQLSADRIESTESRLTDIERQFVDEPRQAVAEARRLLDDLLGEMGHPARASAGERAKDLRYFNRTHSERYVQGGSLKENTSTEELRRVLKDDLLTIRELLAEGREHLPAGDERRHLTDDRPASVAGPTEGREVVPEARREVGTKAERHVEPGQHDVPGEPLPESERAVTREPGVPRADAERGGGDVREVPDHRTQEDPPATRPPV
ncbi:MAG: hypothetical protein M3072_12075 [Candidatus Dormibacteraeota bacterium]|nr:hypothetical protein [Candidatus Dormibacteraeota bacterium]